MELYLIHCLKERQGSVRPGLLELPLLPSSQALPSTTLAVLTVCLTTLGHLVHLTVRRVRKDTGDGEDIQADSLEPPCPHSQAWLRKAHSSSSFSCLRLASRHLPVELRFLGSGPRGDLQRKEGLAYLSEYFLRRHLYPCCGFL